VNDLCLCNWTTIRGTTTTAPITQGEDQYLDVSPFTDLVLWVDCREASGGATLSIQTSPTKDDLYFKNILATITLPTNGTNGPVVYSALASSALVPAAAWRRWQLSGSSSPFDATFRIWLAANSPGR